MEVTEMQAKPLAIGETLAYATRSFVIRLQRTEHSYAVTVERGGFRIDQLARTFATEHEARDIARDVAKRLRDGATVAEVVAAIQPAADVIDAATALLVLDADVRKLSRPQRDAIAAAKNGHIVRGNGVSVSTLYALEGAHLGVCVREDPRRAHRVTGFDLSVRGLQMRAHILTHQHPIAA